MQQAGEGDVTSLHPQPQILEAKVFPLGRSGCGSPTAAPSIMSRGVYEIPAYNMTQNKHTTGMTPAASPTSCCGQLAMTAFLERAAKTTLPHVRGAPNQAEVP